MKANRFRFRIWDRIQMIDFSLNGYVIEEGGNLDDYPIMQSTGLVDKAGKELFESDIVDFDLPHPSYKTKERAVVKFGDHQTSSDYYASGAYGWYFDSGGFEGETSTAQARPFEIIGNIYENPELLKERS